MAGFSLEQVKSQIHGESEDVLEGEFSVDSPGKKSKLKSKSAHSVVMIKLPEDEEPPKEVIEPAKTFEPKNDILKIKSVEEMPKYPPRPPREFKDDVDRSVHPSFTNFKLPYEVVCRLRYQKAMREYDKQFRRELEKLETMQPSAYEALRFNRLFSITTLWPPLHTKKEIEHVLRNFYKIPHKQQTRLNNLLRDEQH